MKYKRRRNTILFLLFILLPFFTCQIRALAIEDNKIIDILSNNPDLFKENGIVASAFRYLGWGTTKGLAALADVCAELYDTCFGFVDFTNYKPVRDFINEWKPVFIALVCLSLLLIGILLCVGWEKKPKFAINLLIAVVVVSSSTYAINTLNSFISKEVREGILNGQSSSVVYDTIGTNVHDLKWLNKTVGLANLNKKDKGKKNADKVYSSFSENQFENMDIQELLNPEDFEGDAQEILDKGLLSESDGNNKITYSLEEIYDGVAWTDLLNEYYYRYTVDYGVMWLELLSLIIVYLFMSYKVIRILYEIAIHRLLAYLYSTNLNNNQKILKILDSLKDSYILLLMTTVMIKFYLLATKFISAWDISGLAKGLVLLFLAFAAIDGPNLIQKLTGADIGASDGMGKMMSLFYGGRMAAGAVGAAAGAVKSGFGAAKNGFSKAKEMFGKNGSAGSMAQDLAETGTDVAGTDTLNQNTNNTNEKESGNNETNHNNQNNNQNNHADIMENAEKDMGEDKNTGDSTSSNPAEEGQTNLSHQSSEHDESPISTMPSEQSNKNNGYQMEQIGHNQSRNDVLNGIGSNTGKGIDEKESARMMRQMDQDISSGTSKGATTSDSVAGNAPIQAGGHMFERTSINGNDETKESRKNKDIFK